MIYSPTAFNALPSLGKATDAFVTRKAEDQLVTTIRQLFVDFGVCKQYGVALLHKHFPLTPTERLVEPYHTSTAWNIDDTNVELAVVPKYEGLIIPRSYMFRDGSTFPYEFSFVPHVAADTAAYPKENEEFFKAFSALLTSLGLDDVFGVRCLDEYDPRFSVEVTEERTNIMMEKGTVPATQLIEALWVFDPADGPDVLRCHCQELCRKIDKKHVHDHSCG